MEFIDIYLFDQSKSNSNVYTIDQKIINNLKTIKLITKEEYNVYIYKNMHLYIDELTKSKSCYNIESNKYVIDNNKILINVVIVNIPSDSFPLIMNYHGTFKRTIMKYDQNIDLIHDNINGQIIPFIRIKNDKQNIDKLVNQILSC